MVNGECDGCGCDANDDDGATPPQLCNVLPVAHTLLRAIRTALRACVFLIHLL